MGKFIQSKTFCYIMAVVFYLAAVIAFFKGHDSDVVLLCFGSMWLCIGSSLDKRKRGK